MNDIETEEERDVQAGFFDRNALKLLNGRRIGDPENGAALSFADALFRLYAAWEEGTGELRELADLLRQSVYSRLAGYEDVNDAERLSQDPTRRLAQLRPSR